LKRYAARSTDLKVAPRLHAASRAADERLRQLQSVYGAFSPLAVAVPAARSSLLLAGVVLSPLWGAVALACHALQPYLVTAGGPLERPSGGRSALADAVKRLVDPLTLVRAALASAGSPARGDDPIESRRAGYTTALAGGIEHFFEPRRDRCPWCGSSAIQERLRTSDLAQYKPGEFVIDECISCGLLFQNPRLSLDGLDFYYRDFYDGLGNAGAQMLFGYSEPAYRGRVALARRHFKEPPRAWLDVGSGYGHFCVIARGLLTETRFDGLDIGTGIEEAEARRWVDHAYRGLFPDLADGLAGQYDVVSMHHYLEHTRDPRAELEAAYTTLIPGGHLLIEVPDPESRYSRLLGRYWLPWLQPQHQHLLSVHHLVTELTAQGFSVVEVERGPAHQPVDLGGAIWTWAGNTAPKPRAPWLDDPTPVQRVGRTAVLAAAAPFALAGVAADRALQPVISTRAQRWSNAYRLLARRL
jgi:SAM-dependent methyltransferase